MKRRFKMKKQGFWKYALPAVLAATMALNTETASAQTVFNSTGSGKWVGVEPTAFDNQGAVGLSIPGDYRGTRWDNTSRWTFSLSNTSGEFLSHPGSESYSTDDTYAGIVGVMNDTVNIRNGHHITLDSPMPGSGVGEFGKVGILNINAGGSMTVASLTVGAAGLLTNAGTLNVTFADVHAEAGLVNTGTVNVTGTSNVSATNVDNMGTINVTGSTDGIHADNFQNKAGAIFSLTDSTVTTDTLVSAGAIKLSNSTLIGGGGGITLQNGHSIQVTGDSTIEGKINAGSEGINITGTTPTSTTNFGTITGGSGMKMNLANTQTVLNSANLAAFSEVVAGAQARLNGTGSSAVDFIMNSGSWLRPGNSPGIFEANDITFNGGSFIFIEVDFATIGAGDGWDQVLAANDINFVDGTTTIYVTNFNGAAGDAVYNADILKSTAGNILVGGEDLSTLSPTGGGTSEVTIAGTGATILIKSTKTAAGDDVVEFDFVDLGHNYLALDITALVDDTDVVDPSTPPVDPSGPGTPAVKQSSNYDTLLTVVNAMTGTNLNSAVGAAFVAGGSTDDALIAIISQLDPVALSLGSGQTEQAIFGFNNTVFERIRYYTASKTGGVYRGQECDPCGMINPCDPCGSGRFGGREFWFQGQGGLIDQQDLNGIAGYYTNTYGFALGADRKIARNTVVGFGFANSFFDTTMNYGLGTANTKSYLLSAYGGHKVGNWELSGAVGYVRGNLAATRVADLIGGWAQSKRNADTAYGSFELARRYGNDWSYVTPFLAYDFIQYNEQGYTETGHLIDMTVGKRKVEASVQTLGSRFGWQYVNRSGSVINPSFTAGWVHDYGKGYTTTGAAFNQGLAVPFIVEGTARHRDRALLGFNVNAALSRSLSVFGRYDTELANRYNSQNFQAGMTVQF
jgi:uncharacterized protein with beta-barrel porin domain